MSEIHDLRLDRLEEDVREIRQTIAGLVPLMNRIDERLNSVEREMSHLATKEEVAHLPTRGYLWGVMGAMVGAYTAALAAAALLASIILPRLPPQAPVAPPAQLAAFVRADTPAAASPLPPPIRPLRT